ncbi:MAG TPA: hypothetical protein VG755_12360 [Nannocystaceae bacterium]|nr:hypothetical protein [Nannocystaceae bacterium]
MSDSIKIQVYTQASPDAATKTPVTDATVALMPRADADKLAWPYDKLKATHDHDKDGFYKPKSSAPIDPGEYLLVVQKKTSSPVVQRLTLSVKAGVIEVKAGWDKKHGATFQAATVSIVNVGQRATPSSDVARFATINVLLLARTEWVGLASHNHFSRRPPPHRDGTRYLPFALGRRNQLYKAKVLDKATIATILDCQGRRTLVTVKSAVPQHNDWVTISEKEKKPIDAALARPDDTSDDEIGIEDFYQTVHDIGFVNARTLIEAGVFGHGWVQGPLVWGTSDFEPTEARWPGGRGTPKDLDGRQKDFIVSGQKLFAGPATSSPFRSAFPEFLGAFRKGGQLRLWGCVHMNNVLAQTSEAKRQLDKKTSRSTFFTIAFPDGGRESATLDDVKRNVAQAVVSQLFGRALEHGDSRGNVAYGGAAAQFCGTNCDVFAAPTGMGSNYAMRGGDNVFVVVDGGENKLPYAWWRAEFGADFEADADGYMNYSKLKGAKLPDPGWRTERHAVIVDDSTSFTTSASSTFRDWMVLKLPSDFEAFIQRGHATKTTFAAPVAHTIGSASGHLYIVHNATVAAVLQRPLNRCALLGKSDTTDSAFFVDTTGKTRVLEAPAGSKPAAFTVRTSAIDIRATRHAFRNDWEVQAKTGSITDGVVETVTPKWFW